MAVTTGADTGRTFALEDEDHTVANALRFLLNKKCAPLRAVLLFSYLHCTKRPLLLHHSPHVSFVGYSIPHPSEAVVNLRVQTTGGLLAGLHAERGCMQAL